MWGKEGVKNGMEGDRFEKRFLEILKDGVPVDRSDSVRPGNWKII